MRSKSRAYSAFGTEAAGLEVEDSLDYRAIFPQRKQNWLRLVLGAGAGAHTALGSVPSTP